MGSASYREPRERRAHSSVDGERERTKLLEKRAAPNGRTFVSLCVMFRLALSPPFAVCTLSGSLAVAGRCMHGLFLLLQMVNEKTTSAIGEHVARLWLCVCTFLAGMWIRLQHFAFAAAKPALRSCVNRVFGRSLSSHFPVRYRYSHAFWCSNIAALLLRCKKLLQTTACNRKSSIWLRPGPNRVEQILSRWVNTAFLTSESEHGARCRCLRLLSLLPSAYAQKRSINSSSGHLFLSFCCCCCLPGLWLFVIAFMCMWHIRALNPKLPVNRNVCSPVCSL